HRHRRGLPAGRATGAPRRRRRARLLVMDFRWPPPPDGRPDRYRPPVTRGPQTVRPTLPAPPTEQVATPHGVELEWSITAEEPPPTVFAHRFCGSTRAHPPPR